MSRYVIGDGYIATLLLLLRHYIYVTPFAVAIIEYVAMPATSRLALLSILSLLTSIRQHGHCHQPLSWHRSVWLVEWRRMNVRGKGTGLEQINVAHYAHHYDGVISRRHALSYVYICGQLLVNITPSLAINATLPLLHFRHHYHVSFTYCYAIATH